MPDKKIINIINKDKKLKLIFGGMVLDGVAFIGIIVFMCMWMLL